MNLTDIQIPENASIVEALRKLNKIRDVSRLILFVTDQNRAVVGSLTDGDIRRSLAKDMDIHKKIKLVCNRNFIFEWDHKDHIELQPIREKKIKILPILNKARQLERIIDLEKTLSVLPIECVIMAGGRGKRLSPLTDSIPKPMLPLGDKPILEHNIDRLISYGIRKFYIAVNYLGEQIENYFKDGSSKGVEIEYIRENKALGTAGALSMVENFKTNNVLLMNGDLFTDIDFSDLYNNMINKKADIIVASTEYKVDVPYAIFETEEGSVTGFCEKPTYVYHSNAGIYILKRELIKRIPKDKYFDITDLLDLLMQEGSKVTHNPIVGYWVDIGKPIDYKKAQEFIKHLK